jgi:flagellar hook-associated protein 3 FlgL
MRVAALGELRRLREQMVALGNTRIGDEYLFAGARTDTPPFLADGTYVGDAVVRRIEVDEGVWLDVGDPGDAAFGDALAALSQLETELAGGTQATIGATITALDGAQRQLSALDAEVGARQRVIRESAARIAARVGQLLDQRTALRDADPTESVLKVTSGQNALERAYEAVGRILRSSLLEHLK